MYSKTTKKINTALLLLCAAVAVIALGPAADAQTHTVLGEFGTATTCGPCKYGHAALKNIYAGGQHDFVYVTHVADVNTHSYDRLWTDYNTYGYPTVYFDGGYDLVLGSVSTPQAEADYTAAITNCASRTVPNIDLDIDVIWLGNATMDISVQACNYEATTRDVRLRVFVTEIESTLGWDDTNGDPYTFALLDYAFDVPLSLPPGLCWSDTVTWDGALHNNGYGVTFDSITMDNVMVVAALFDGQANQGYSNPPNDNPFNAYYVDQAAAVMPRVPYPVPDIKADGNDGPYSIPSTQNVSLTISLEPNDFAGTTQDWWIVAQKSTGGYFSWVYSIPWHWTAGLKRAHVGPLFALNNYSLHNGTIPLGTWYVLFGVDDPDNTYQGTYQDLVILTSY